MAKYNLQNRGSNLSRMGVEQKPLFVTQVDKLEAKIQVRKIHQPKICSSLKSFHLLRLSVMQACWVAKHPTPLTPR